ncbi:MAG: hypothetical protein HZT40_22445 [Candidatus Thiothrix singaporensis]|uniref:DUF5681 domain-containing protein n=1 Tax=Candidatus Thiothrix singaporensis TaxID=2799669 RepID=A0A7L6AYB7_9GAMM|nr:MAG: hypothetical protein HZT40_22445 [Candidatus Thiothrix singaporensis]
MSRAKGTPKTGGRKAGTPNKVQRPIREAAMDYSDEALAKLVEIMQDPETPAAARITACREVLDRAHGKPTQNIDANVNKLKQSEWLDIIAKANEGGTP